MKKIKVGVVGLRRGKTLMECLLKIPGAVLTAICDIDQNVLREVTEEFRTVHGLKDLQRYVAFEEFLQSDIDAVIIATPATVHIPLVRQAMEAGKHVLSEIPAVDSIEEASELRQIVQAHPDLKYMAGENCCFLGFSQSWKSMYEEGLLGEVFYAEADYIHDTRYLQYDENGQLTWRAHYDAVKYLTHDLGVLLYVMDDECVSVTAFTPEVKVTGPECTGHSNQVAIFRTKKGAVIKFFAAFATESLMKHNYSIYGSKGTLMSDRSELHWEKAKTLAYFKSMPHVHDWIRIPVEGRYPWSDITDVHGGGDTRMLMAFVECLQKDLPSPMSVDLGLRMSLPGIYAAMSARQGSTTIEIPPVSTI